MKLLGGTVGRRIALTMLAGALFVVLASMSCSGNRRVSVGGSVHFGSGGWGHGLSVGIHSHGRR